MPLITYYAMSPAILFYRSSTSHHPYSAAASQVLSHSVGVDSTRTPTLKETNATDAGDSTSLFPLSYE